MLWTTDKLMRVAFWGLISWYLASILSTLGLTSWSITFPLFWCLSAGIYLYKANIKLPSTGKAVLITGCDSGFGNAAALHLDNLGFRVFAGCLLADAGGERAERLRKEGSDRLHVIQLDVTKEEELAKALDEVKNLLPDSEVLWGLVNNAGVCTLGLVEWTPLENFRRDSEVNYFGMAAATKTFLPLVRKAKGRVVNLASVSGRISVPLMASYCASKYAVEAFNDTLRLEMKPWGVHVSAIEPGNYGSGTELFKRNDQVKQDVKALWDSLSEQLKDDYGEHTCKKCEAFMNNFRKSGRSDVSPVTNAITEALSQAHPQSRYLPQEPFLYFMVFVGTHFPEFVYDGLLDVLSMLGRTSKKKDA